jgi:argininosuccinate lyase
MAEDRGCGLSDLSPADLRTIHPLFSDDVSELWDYAASADRRDTEGGASKRSLTEQVAKIRAYLDAVAAEEA